MRHDDLRAFPLPTFSSEVAPLASSPIDRAVLARIQRTVPSARIRYRLWDGFELPSPRGAPVATITVKNRPALLRWLWDPELNFGEAYMFGALDVQGDLVAMLEEIYREFQSPRSSWWWLRRRANDIRTAR